MVFKAVLEFCIDQMDKKNMKEIGEMVVLKEKEHNI
jgi:hypothetical protein